MTVYSQHGLLVRIVYLLIAALWHLGTSARRLLHGPHRGAVVLCYHGVGDHQRSRFLWQMAWLADRAMDTADLNDACPAPGSRLGVCVTFDDAFANLLQNALPIMQQLEVPAAIFAVPGNLDDAPRWSMPADHPEKAERIMSAAEIRQADSVLCRFGSHTVTHPDLTTLPPEPLRQQLVQSRLQLQEILGHGVDDLAIPFGFYDARVLAAARAAGYKRIHTLDAHLRPSASGVVGRFSMTPDVWRVEFRLTCLGAYAWLHVWRRLLRRLRRSEPADAHKEPALA